MPLAQVIFDESRAMLNDVANLKYTNAVLTPFLKKAYRAYQQKMNRVGLEITEEVSATIAVTAGTKALGEGTGLPADFVMPLDIHERAPGGTDNDWTLMVEGGWDVTEPQQSTLAVWNWREEEIKFRGATGNREILLHYVKSLAAIADGTSPVQVISAEGFLAAKTAAFAAFFIDQNTTRAEVCNGNAAEEWNDFLAARVNRRQSRPVRRRVNRYRQ